MRVYIVTSGDYMGYHIEKVFISEDKAKSYINKKELESKWHESYYIEEFDISDEEMEE